MILDTKTIKELDQNAITKYGLPGVLLMEHAALRIKEYIDQQGAKDKHILILCGPGNNGGDGFALARQLVQDKYSHVEILCHVPFENMSADERLFASICKHYSIIIHEVEEVQALTQLIKAQDVLIDALFGIGLTRNIEGFYETLIQLVNASNKYILSIDMPSGIHADTGKVLNCAIDADVTISFTCYKRGQVVYPGAAYCGEIIIKDIAIPVPQFAPIKNFIQVLDRKLLQTMLPKRNAHSHKGTFGKGLMIGGSAAMPGAITLAAKSALASGIGTLTLCIPECIRDVLAMKTEECMLLNTTSKDGYFDQDAISLLEMHCPSYDVICIGNGMGRGQVSAHMVKTMLNSNRPCIIDGDALYELGNFTALLQRDAITILTPHVKEMHYLTKKTIQEIQADPFGCVDELVNQYPNVCVVLKDHHSLIAYKEYRFMNLIGNSGLAKGGSGDVLCGMIMGLFAQSKDPLKSVVSGVYAHALAADLLMHKRDVYTMLPSDIIQELSNVYALLKSDS